MGGPRSRVRAHGTLRWALIDMSGNFLLHMSAESPSNISPNCLELVSKFSKISTTKIVKPKKRPSRGQRVSPIFWGVSLAKPLLLLSKKNLKQWPQGGRGSPYFFPLEILLFLFSLVQVQIQSPSLGFGPKLTLNLLSKNHPHNFFSEKDCHRLAHVDGGLSGSVAWADTGARTPSAWAEIVSTYLNKRGWNKAKKIIWT